MPTFSDIRTFATDLKPLWVPTQERCGVITKTGEIVEHENLSRFPEDQFTFPDGALEGVFASWHTHPKTGANLSLDDYYLYLAWPNLVHYIVSSSEVACYALHGDYLVRIDEEEDLPPWVSERAAPGPD